LGPPRKRRAAVRDYDQRRTLARPAVVVRVRGWVMDSEAGLAARCGEAEYPRLRDRLGGNAQFDAFGDDLAVARVRIDEQQGVRLGRRSRDDRDPALVLGEAWRSSEGRDAKGQVRQAIPVDDSQMVEAIP